MKFAVPAACQNPQDFIFSAHPPLLLLLPHFFPSPIPSLPSSPCISLHLLVAVAVTVAVLVAEVVAMAAAVPMAMAELWLWLWACLWLWL